LTELSIVVNNHCSGWEAKWTFPISASCRGNRRDAVICLPSEIFLQDVNFLAFRLAWQISGWQTSKGLKLLSFYS